MTHTVLVIGATDVGRRTCAALQDRGTSVIHLASPTDTELRELLLSDVSGVAIMLPNDIEALRYALTIEHIRPGIRLFVAIFDRSVRHEMERTIPNCSIASPAYIAIPSIVAAALLPHVSALKRTGSTSDITWEQVTLEDGSIQHDAFSIPSKWRRQRWSAILRGQLRAYDSASRALLSGLMALVGMLLVDIVILQRHQSLPAAFYAASAVVAGVAAPDVPLSRWQFIQSGAFMLFTVIFVTTFGAGVVNHVLTGRRVGIVGRRTIPRKNHVIVVGLGQVGIRLCKELALLKIPVVAIEQVDTSRGVLFARDLNIPVIIGNASDVRTLRRARVKHSRALLAMGSSEEDNISVAVATRMLEPNTPIILRAGTNDAIEETRSLFAIGVVSDVNGLTAAFVCESLIGQPPHIVISQDSAVDLVAHDYSVQRLPMPGRCICL